MKKQVGRCSLCGVELESSKMAKHLPECIEEFRRELGGSEELPPRAYLVGVQSARAPMFWLHLLIRDDASLSTLDSFLRDVWMNGPDDAGRFDIAGDIHAADPGRPAGPGQLESDLSVPVSDVIDGEEPFDYYYGRDSATHLTARVISATHMLADRPDTPVRLMARNLAPTIPCSCGRDATHYCPECAGEMEGLLCDVCRQDHDCRAADHYPTLQNTPRALVQ